MAGTPCVMCLAPATKQCSGCRVFWPPGEAVERFLVVSFWSTFGCLLTSQTFKASPLTVLAVYRGLKEDLVCPRGQTNKLARKPGHNPICLCPLGEQFLASDHMRALVGMGSLDVSASRRGWMRLALAVALLQKCIWTGVTTPETHVGMVSKTT